MAFHESVVLYADEAPVPGVAVPRTNQRYRNPRLALEMRDIRRPGLGEALIRPIFAGICGTDLHLVTPNAQTGYVQSSAPALIPPTGRIVGHEGVGEVEAVGDGVSHVRAGDMVALESIAACGECDTCRRGAPNQCRSAKLLGLESDGLFAGRAVLPARLCRPIGRLGDSADGLRAAALLEPAAVAFLAGINSRIAAGDRVLVFGGGPIGMLMAMMARELFGARLVHLVEPVPFRRTLAGTIADKTFSVDGFEGASGSYDVLIDASGALDSVAATLPRIDAGGRVCLLARSGVPFHIEAVDHLLTNNITILGSRGHLGGIFEKLVALLDEGRLPLTRIITSEVTGLQRLKDVLENPALVTEENCKVLCALPGAPS